MKVGAPRDGSVIPGRFAFQAMRAPKLAKVVNVTSIASARLRRATGSYFVQNFACISRLRRT